MVIFDPNIKFLSNFLKNNSQPGIRLKLNQAKTNDLRSYYDQFLPYEDMFECKIFEDNFNYNGTLIRLPLRNEASKISNKIYDNQSIVSLLEILLQNIEILLLFTQSVKKIQVYVLEDAAEPVDMKLLFEYENSLVKYIQKHEIVFKNNFASNNEFKRQTNILRAANENTNASKTVEVCLIVKSSTKLNESNLKKQLNYTDAKISVLKKEA